MEKHFHLCGILVNYHALIPQMHFDFELFCILCAKKCIFHNWTIQKEHEQSNGLNISLSIYGESMCHHEKETQLAFLKSRSHNWLRAVRSSGGYHPQQEKCVANRKSAEPSFVALADTQHWQNTDLCVIMFHSFLQQETQKNVIKYDPC